MRFSFIYEHCYPEYDSLPSIGKDAPVKVLPILPTRKAALVPPTVTVDPAIGVASLSPVTALVEAAPVSLSNRQSLEPPVRFYNILQAVDEISSCLRQRASSDHPVSRMIRRHPDTKNYRQLSIEFPNEKQNLVTITQSKTARKIISSFARDLYQNGYIDLKPKK